MWRNATAAAEGEPDPASAWAAPPWMRVIYSRPERVSRTVGARHNVHVVMVLRRESSIYDAIHVIASSSRWRYSVRVFDLPHPEPPMSSAVVATRLSGPLIAVAAIGSRK